jgi:hypothetical protein
MAGNIKVVTVNTTDKVGILNARNALFGRTQLGSDYLGAVMGMFYTFVPLASDDLACVNESILPASYLDWFTIGLKNHANAEPPGKAGSQFVGFCNTLDTATNLVLAKNDVASGSLTPNTRAYVVSCNGATTLTAINTGLSIQFPIFSATNVNAFFGLKITVQNYGLSTQTITVAYLHAIGPQTDVSSAALRTACFNTTPGTARVLNWFAGGVALPLPEAFWVLSPFNNNRLRVTNIDAWRIAA